MQGFIQELLQKIEDDSMLMLLSIISVVVILVILLIFVVSTMRVRIYKDRWWNVKVENQHKTTYITTLEQALQSYKIKDARNIQELSHYEENKKTLQKNRENFATLQEDYYQLSNTLSVVKVQLANETQVYQTLQKGHQTLLVRFDSTVEENMTHRTNNARLVSKLEAEERKAKR
ncbi:MAG: hypothetical protein Q9M36_08620 [Sulfurovum sp.]|nr:hypothetical protein [Sulfurovum sp.]